MDVVDPKIYVELVNTNIKPDVKSYSLHVKQKNNSKVWYPGTSVAWGTTGDFIGLVHHGDGYEFLTQLQLKNCWLCTWQSITMAGEKSCFLPLTAQMYYI
jgi:hypothetical protein